MRNLLLLLLLAAVSLLAIRITANPGQKSLKTSVDEIIQPYLQRNEIPGAAIAIYYKGKEYYFNYGVANKGINNPVTQDTIFELASVTKVFTATLLALQVENDTISLDDSIAKYIPSLESTTGLPIDQVTFKNLATHTASFPRDITGFQVRRGNLDALLKRLPTWEPKYPIGTRFVYSNIGFGTLGYAVGQAASLPYPELLKKEILNPLNMQDTYIYVPSEKLDQRATGYSGVTKMPAPFFEPTQILGGGELHSTSRDLMQFLKANLYVQTGQASSNLLNAMQLAQRNYFKVNNRFTMGLGWQRILLNNELFVSKDGANRGFNTFIAFSPTKKYGIVVLVNSNGAHIRRVSRHLLMMLDKKD